MNPAARYGTALLGAGAVVFAGTWAFRPLASPALAPSPAAAAEVPPAREEITSLDLNAFRAPLWIAPPPPPPPVVVTKEPAPPPPRPLKLQLLAVAREADGKYRAIVYDPDLDTLLSVAEGEQVGSRTVESVDADGVRLRDGRAIRALALRESDPKVHP